MFAGLYDDRRAAQCAAFLLHLAGGSLGILKLTKLLYLAERLSYERYGEPLTGATPFALQQGPVLSELYDRLKRTENLNDTWRTWVKGRNGNDISLDHDIDDPAEEFSDLSRADFKVMASIWKDFGGKTGYELVTYTHSHCPEWSDPGRSSHKIDPDTVLRKVGMKREDAAKQIQHLRQSASLRRTREEAEKQVGHLHQPASPARAMDIRFEMIN